MSALEVAPAVCPVKLPCRMTVPVPALGVALSLGGTVAGDDAVGAAVALAGTDAGFDAGGGVEPEVVQAADRSRMAPRAAVARDLMRRLV
jgi:hypothetical protein